MTTQEHGTKARLWWAGLIFFGVASLALNIAHAMKTPNIDGWVAVLVGVAPVVACAFMSHGVGDSRPGAGIWVARCGIMIVFLMGMKMSIEAQASVVAPILKADAIYLPLILDLSTFISLFMIMSAARAANAASLKAEVRAALEAEARAEIEAEAEAKIRPIIEAQMDRRLRAEVALAEASVEARLREDVEAEVETRVEAMAAEITRRAEVETEARVRTEMSTGSKRAGGRTAPAKSARMTADQRKDQARILIAQDPEITGGGLGRALGLTEVRGRQILREIKEELAQMADATPRPPLRSAG